MKIGKYVFKKYPISDNDIPENWRVFTRHKIFGFTFFVWELK